MSESQEVIEAVKLLKERFKDNADALMSALFGEGEFTLSEMDAADEAAREKIVVAARANYQEEGAIEIDDGAAFSRGDDNPERGLYVAAWVWVPDGWYKGVPAEEGDWYFTVESDVFGSDEYGSYDTEADAEEGITRIKAEAKELNDGIVRLYTAPYQGSGENPDAEEGD